MKFISIALVTFTCVLAIEPSLNSGKNDRIIEGIPTEDFCPYTVSISFFGAQICKGSIIARNWVLTAAHCIVGAPVNSLVVIAGRAGSGQSGTIHKVDGVFIHGSYEPNALLHDVALLYLSAGFSFGTHTSPISICSFEIGSTDSETCGLRSKLRTISNQECATYLGILIYSSNICAIGQPNELAAYNISGAPLISASDKCLIGIGSWTVLPAGINPGVFSRTSRYLSWIRSITGI